MRLEQFPTTGLDEFNPTVTPDELNLFFAARSPDGDLDIYAATRASRDVAFGNVRSLPKGEGLINVSGYDELGPSVRGDGLALYFQSSRPGGLGQENIWVSTRQALKDPFGPAVLVQFEDPPSAQRHLETKVSAFISFDGSKLWFSNAYAIVDFYVSEALKVDSFRTERGVVELSTAGEDVGMVTVDGLGVFFTSEVGLSQPYNRDVFFAARGKPTDPFAAPTRVSDISSPFDEGVHGISGDGCTLYFETSRNGDYDLYFATRRE